MLSWIYYQCQPIIGKTKTVSFIFEYDIINYIVLLLFCTVDIVTILQKKTNNSYCIAKNINYMKKYILGSKKFGTLDDNTLCFC